MGGAQPRRRWKAGLLAAFLPLTKSFDGFVGFVTKKEWNGRLERQNPPVDWR